MDHSITKKSGGVMYWYPDFSVSAKFVNSIDLYRSRFFQANTLHSEVTDDASKTPVTSRAGSLVQWMLLFTCDGTGANISVFDRN
jgi:hypothetical protein